VPAGLLRPADLGYATHARDVGAEGVTVDTFFSLERALAGVAASDRACLIEVIIVPEC
jgi:thiamine pyrophosphate-dependent acetolactate synthase large subunit-like protein